MQTECLISIAAQCWKDKLAITDGSKKISYQELSELVSKASFTLLELLPEKIAQVGLIVEKPFDFIVLFFALLKLGINVCVLSSKDTKESLSYKLDLTSTKFLISDKNLNFENVSILSSDSVLADLSSLDIDSVNFQKYGNIIVFSSGTLGAPKAVIHSLDTFVLGASESNQRLNFTSDDDWLLSLSLSSVAGLTILFRVFLAGAGLLLPSNLSMDSLCTAFEKYSNFFVSLVPSMVKIIYQEKGLRPKFKVVLLGGEAIDDQVIEIVERFQVKAFNSYGLSETAANVSCTNGNFSEDLKTVGTSLGSTHIEIVDGEIVLSGPRVCKTWIEPGKKIIETNGRICTGDLGTWQGDKLVILGRRDRRFISGGVNIDPVEIENFVNRIQGIRASAVISIKDIKWGQRPILFIESMRKNNRDLEDITESILSSLGRVKTPERIVCLESFPRTLIGKIDYQKLKNLL
ncbi:MAG: AMP-binding protein [Bdellovibrionales bacterium]|nr:AMP-binding protein [Bdellovibrionales bacterium]